MLLCSSTIRYSLVCFNMYLPLSMMREGFLTCLWLGGATKGSIFREGDPPPVPAMHFSYFWKHMCWNPTAVTKTLMPVFKSSSYPKEPHWPQYQFFSRTNYLSKIKSIWQSKTTINACIDLHSETVSWFKRTLEVSNWWKVYYFLSFSGSTCRVGNLLTCKDSLEKKNTLE